jgi:hypothetical protein
MGCGCVLALFALLSPRLAVFFVWLFTDRMGIAFDHWWMGFVGFVFLPWTTLAWALCYAPVKGVTGFGWIIVLLGLITDLGTYGGSSQMRRSQAPA